MRLPFVWRKRYERAAGNAAIKEMENLANSRYINVLQARNDALRTECEGLIEQIENSSGKKK